MEDCPKDTGIRQIFLFDPDGNVIEISNCSPEVGETRCEVKRSESSDHTVREEYFTHEDGHEPSVLSGWSKESCDGTEVTTIEGTTTTALHFLLSPQTYLLYIIN